MKTNLTGTELLNSIYDANKDNFKPGMCSFHNLLWQLIINETWKDTNIHCFVPVYQDGGNMIAIAENNKYGYHPTYVFFADGIDYKQANNICKRINEEMFGLLSDACDNIVASSMRKQPRRREATPCN